MRKFLRIGATVAVANLLLFWTDYAILTAAWPHTGLSQWLGFSPAPPLSPWLGFLMWSFVALGAPASI
ncbi:MAG TPA: hypothetical protein VNT26_15110, partial [Candidatus Sulfotelmatobacter sp.]|nr:hypothetical protein [Candidatus Sulfotelmatobacter sp.]